ncbi:DUF948 domain-containing protein [Ileibacterium valens]|uniref:DUF948 domain-containing protein n=2 Tax=Ileibacterium valens TaxID=1862668 RepID=A0A1U7NHM4_9FIRM|nr:DUF948 domain-containing protein [Ileibacterium valens]OLU38627.1 hypothetical protein BM735_09060 [Erysipelotrichaceae bacterium NYU-BL-F16]OLU41436.1 hypothetical protein BO222_03320 [Ileibacterium valens]OLU43030.1 hypothetical protein BO224_00845 [Erysipelotrichaceae bacterium NYU-BL-E8]
MYISFDLLIKIGQVIMIVAACAVLIYLALVFKHLIDTVKETTKTLEVLQRDLEKLESPLETVDAVSKTVDELQASVKKTATSALGVMDDSISHFKERLNKPKASRNMNSFSPSAADVNEEDNSNAEFVPIADLNKQAAQNEVKNEEAGETEIIVIEDDETKE